MEKNLERFSPICNSKMKSITKYLKESFEQVNEGKDKYFYFTFAGLENADETIESIVHIANTKGLYYEKIDDGIKVKGKDSNVDKFDSIIDVVQQYIENLRQKEEEESEKVNKESLEKLSGQLNKLTEWVEDHNSEENSEEEKKEDKKKEDKDKKDKEDE